MADSAVEPVVGKVVGVRGALPAAVLEPVDALDPSPLQKVAVDLLAHPPGRPGEEVEGRLVPPDPALSAGRRATSPAAAMDVGVARRDARLGAGGYKPAVKGGRPACDDRGRNTGSEEKSK
ncbi:hypothetical protein [Streptomyces vinaceus]|uniref:hypothetical protein n=1 Tax=Streptomyces vinaceus TaxID=1960 RepID=UPI0035DB3825